MLNEEESRFLGVSSSFLLARSAQDYTLSLRNSVFQDPNSVFVIPSETRTFNDLVYNRLLNHIATRFDVLRSSVKRIVPKTAVHWGKIQWLNDGDMMHALDFVRDPGRPGRRDMTFIKVGLLSELIYRKQKSKWPIYLQYTVLQDQNFHLRNRRPAGVDVVAGYYGQLQSLFVVELPPSTILRTTETTTLALAAVLPIKMDRRNGAGQVVCRANEFDPLEVVDIQSLDSVVGRIIDRGKWVFVEQLGAREVTQIGDDPEAVVRPQNSRLR